jgi:hypothetical protein
MASSENCFFQGWAKDFFSNSALKTAGILCVFQGFHKQKLGKKIRPERKRQFLEVAHTKKPPLNCSRGG